MPKTKKEEAIKYWGDNFWTAPTPEDQNQNQNQVPVWNNLYPGQQYLGGPIAPMQPAMTAEQQKGLKDMQARLQLIKDSLTVGEYEFILKWQITAFENMTYEYLKKGVDILNKIMKVYEVNLENSYTEYSLKNPVKSDDDKPAPGFELNVSDVLKDIFNVPGDVFIDGKEPEEVVDDVLNDISNASDDVSDGEEDAIEDDAAMNGKQL